MAGEESHTNERHRVTFRMDSDDYERVKYWAAKWDMSIQEYVCDAVLQQIAHENRDYDIPDIMTQRVNQLVDVVKVLSEDVHSLEQVTVNGFDSLIGLTRGDNYLLEDESGEL